MKIVHFSGEGTKWMSGIREYIMVIEDEEEDMTDHCAPGFEVTSETIIADLPSSFPTESMLIVRD